MFILVRGPRARSDEVAEGTLPGMLTASANKGRRKNSGSGECENKKACGGEYENSMACNSIYHRNHKSKLLRSLRNSCRQSPRLPVKVRGTGRNRSRCFKEFPTAVCRVFEPPPCLNFWFLPLRNVRFDFVNRSLLGDPKNSLHIPRNLESVAW